MSQRNLQAQSSGGGPGAEVSQGPRPAATLCSTSDGWGSPRWQQADTDTGGDPRHERLLDRIPSGSLLDRIPPGSCLDPLPRRQRFSRARCDRCGCWISAARAILPGDGWLYCAVCGGSTPTSSRPAVPL